MADAEVSAEKLQPAAPVAGEDEAEARTFPFPFFNCGGLQDERRLILKSKAKDAGLERANSILTLLDNAPEHANDPTLKKIRAMIREAELLDRKGGILVGISGTTGAGKSSLSCALLGLPNFLPIGEEEATTSVTCIVRWNYDSEPGREFKVVIVFKQREEIVKDLHSLLVALANRKEYETAEYENEDHRLEDLEETTAEIEKGMRRFETVWPIQEETLEAEVLDCADDGDALMALSKKIYDSVPGVGGLVSKSKKEMFSSEASEIAEMMKPYIDASPASHDDGEDFAAWSLVSHVEVFACAPLLKNGCRLVDLPGEWDANTSRHNVAGGFQGKLHMTMIAAAIQRAADEKGTHLSINSGMRSRLDMDGLLNKDHLGIVLTKTDALDPETYKHRQPDQARDKRLLDNESSRYQGWFKKLDKEQHRLKESIGIAQVKFDSVQGGRTLDMNPRDAKKPKVNPESQKAGKKPKIKTEKIKTEPTDFSMSGISAAIQGYADIPDYNGDDSDDDDKVRTLMIGRRILGMAKSEWHGTINARSRAKLGMNFVKELKAHKAISARNAYVVQRCRKKMEQLEASINRGKENQSRRGSHEGTELASFFPTSSHGLWKIRNEGGAIAGMPTEIFTGIPALSQWIQRNVGLGRERHTQAIISRLNTIFNLSQLFADPNFSAVDEPITADRVQKELDSVHTRGRNIIDEGTITIKKGLWGIDPLEDRQTFKGYLEEKANEIAAGWIKADPKDRASPKDAKAINAATQRAVLRRGGVFTARSGIRYNWIGQLQDIIVQQLAGRWRDTIEHEVQKMFHLVEENVAKQWDLYCDSIMTKLEFLGSKMAGKLPELKKAILESGKSLCDEINKILEGFKEKACRCHHGILAPVIRRHCVPYFERLAKLRGPGCRARRQDRLEEHIKNTCGTQFHNVLVSLESSLRQCSVNAWDKIKPLPAKAVEEVRTAIRCCLAPDQRSETADFRRRMKEILVEWAQDWRLVDHDSPHVLNEDTSIPDTLRVEHLGPSHPIMTDNDFNYYDILLKAEAKSEKGVGLFHPKQRSGGKTAEEYARELTKLVKELE